jgi:hypothetical protein
VVSLAGWKTLSVDQLAVLAEVALFLWHQAKSSYVLLLTNTKHNAEDSP